MEGRVAIVTGGGQGIGAATARLLAQRGAAVTVNYLSNSAAADQLVAEIKKSGGKATAIRADIRIPEQVNELVSQTLSEYKRIDIMVNNANMSFVQKPFLEMAWDEFAQKLNDEMKAAFYMTKAVAPTMIEQKYGRLVYVASGLAKHPGPRFIAHGSSKAALAGFVRYIAQELGPHGITANTVSPGLTETRATAAQPAEFKQRLVAVTPMSRIGQPDDVAKVIAFYASEDCGFVTGAYTPVNGGAQME